MDASTPLRIVIAGATGWAGSALARAVAKQADMTLAGAVGARSSGKRLGECLGEAGLDAAIYEDAKSAITPSKADVYVEYSKPKDIAVVRNNIVAALEAGAHVVVASSGLSDADYAHIDEAAKRANRGVLAAGNFALTAVLLQRFAEMAARYVPHFEIIDYAEATKRDAPSGTGRQLAAKLAQVRRPALGVPLDEVNGPPGVRGATVNGVQVHSLRVPGFVLGIEVIFGMHDQRLHLTHQAGNSAEPYVDGALLAIRKVPALVGVTRGLDRVMDL
jgi:4-hydroxy-tetrahydrodipicolinate reductase